MTAAVLTAWFDAEGRLREADPPLAGLNARAGGRVGEPLALPALATVVRLARRLGIVVSRAVTVADEENDVEMWARAQPDAEGVRLAVSGWREVAPALPRRLRGPLDEAAAAGGDWRWETDAALRLTLVAPEAGRRHGFDPFALLGKPMTALFDLESEGDGLLPILSALAGRGALSRQPARLRPTGTPLRLSAAVRPESGGGFGGFVGWVEVVAPGAEASGSAPLPASFTEGLDRALRVPLARIVAHADSINAGAEGPVASDYAGYAADIASAGRHLIGLVDDLVDLEAVERPDFAPAGEPIDLADVARRAAGLLSVRAGNAAVTIDRPALEVRAPATGDFRRTLQILVNLIANAIRYTAAGGIVRVEVAHAGERVEAVVSDTGKGIAAADQARIFEKFERVDPSEPGGNGLGLYIARRLARAMAGDLTVESAPGEGARFTLTLPARP
jgi:signal transduction histidine kinase